MNEFICRGRERHVVKLDDTASLVKHTAFHY